MKKWYLTLLFPILYFLGCGGITTSVTTPKQNVNEVVKYHGPKARIAVASFKCKAAKCNGQIGSGIADMLTTALFRSGKFIVLERSGEGLGAIEKEYSLNTTMNRPKRNLEGADILVVGAITAFEPKAGGITAGGIVVPKGVPFIGGMKFGKNEAYIAADIRLIDVRTGRIINATTVEGKASQWSVGGLGGGITSGIALGGGLSVYKNTPMEKAVRVMIDKAVKAISQLVPENYYRYDASGNPVKPSVQSSGPSSQNTVKENYKLIFSEDFEKYGIGQTAPFGNWRGDKFPVKVGVQSNGKVGKVLETYEYRKICLNNVKVKDVVVSADWSHNISLWFRVVSKKPVVGYVVYASDNGEVRLDKVAGKTKITMAKNRIHLSNAKWHTLKVVAKGDHLSVYVDGQVAVDIHDNDKMLQQAGTVCVGAWCCTSMADNIKIYKIGK
jgi:curli biogenesis system outer membrane secretion channel CsgG